MTPFSAISISAAKTLEAFAYQYCKAHSTTLHLLSAGVIKGPQIMSGADDIFGTSYRLTLGNPRSALRTSAATGSTFGSNSNSMSSLTAMQPSAYDPYTGNGSSPSAMSYATGTISPIRDRSRSPAPHVHFADAIETTYGVSSLSSRRSNFTDPPKIRQLFMSSTFVQDVEDTEWTTASTTPKIEASLKVGGVDWVFKVQKRAIEGAPHVGFTLVCGSKLKSALWRIAADAKIIIKKDKEDTKSVDRSYPNNEFTFASKTLADMIPWDEIDTTLACSNKADAKSPVTLNFELQVDITKIYGFRRRARYEYSFDEPSVETDMILMIENREIYVNGTYLAMLSPFFRSLQKSKNASLYGEVASETINDVSADDFLELLHVVYPSAKPVTVDNVELLLKLGDRYNFECVLVKCENFLVTPKADEIDVFTRLEWASQYAMADLQDHCVSKLTNAQAVGAVKKTLLYGSLSHETRKLLLELMLKFNNM
ncbi:unnamed protein product [Cylicocyclus nassatus]|uniref:BTB domain-containing protein n=1 Tax=Cylicocyclus nassatus TaxID=53992 RepID=A0AA36DS81_CYLNA|nr:unnamed protein product [Cylicocyclus nassatus]